MTDNVKHSSSYFHEAIAHAFEMFKNGYEPVMETPFQPRRLGSAFVTEYKAVRESLDDPNQLTIQQKWEIDDELAVINMTEEQSKAISDRGKEARLKRLHEKYDQSEGDAYYFLTLLERDIEQEEINPIPKELLDRMQELRDKAEANRGREEALNELAAQSQGLGMYDRDNGIFDRLVESIESAQRNPEGCVSTVVEVDKERVRVYSKPELENMEWSEFKKLIDAAGIRGRRRQNLTRDYLIYQEENLK